jgi:hypothetical protein
MRRATGAVTAVGILFALARCAGPIPSVGPTTVSPPAPTTTPPPSPPGATVRVTADGTVPCQVSYYGCRAVMTIVPAGPGDSSPPPLIEVDAIEIASDRDDRDHATVDETQTLAQPLSAGGYLVVGESQLTSDLASIAPDGSTVFPAVAQTGRCTAALTVSDAQALGGATVTVDISYLASGGCVLSVGSE